MDFQFLFNPLKIRISKSNVIENENISSSNVEQMGSGFRKTRFQPMTIKNFQPIVRSKTKGGSLAKSNNIRMIF
jgi:hypothetical protein